MSSPVAEFYKGADIFLTGGTGFVGVALIEKLLRCFGNDIGKIYLLIRSKKDVPASQRVLDLPKNSVFEKFIAEKGDGLLKEKLVAVSGDVGSPDLGLSDSDKAALKNVSIVFHSAATLDFEANLKTTYEINLLGTRRVIELCKSLPKFKALLHVSSAYANSNRNQAEEVLYEVPGDVEKVGGLVSSLNDAALEEVTPTVLGNHPNTYTFTKALAEHAVAESGLNTCIIRPSMIIGAWKEPVPGWTISKNGPQGFLMAASKGVVRRLPVSKNLVYDYIPVDIVINHMILGAYKADPSTPIYHCTSSTCNPFRWADVEERIHEILHKYPLKSAVWYPALKLLPSLFLFRLSALIFHILPAFILDNTLALAGGRRILMRLHRNINGSLDRLAPFIFQEWMYDNRKTVALHESLKPADQERFGVDIRQLRWPDLFDDLAKGVRRYLNKESDSTIPAGRKKDTILMFANYLVQGVFFYVIWYLTSTVLRTSYSGGLYAASSIFAAIMYFL
nr:PREDICTED: putative fatty acyl-CoA reductase CG8306 [Bemisia tabaci]XP_018900097.1 PREDICTED: putative fatty acyl-CoA reductase CG8306 [Bemisia tabaci]